MLRPACIAVVLCLSTATAQEFPGRTSTWHGFARHDFTIDGRHCILVRPQQAAAGRPWVWRARFFGHQPGADRALLARGYHLAYCDVAGLYGAPAAVAHWDAFYAFAVEQQQLAAKVALEGMSRGGLIIYNWAAANPDKVAAIYGDAPVCDIRSWPGGKGRGKGSAGDWQRCLQAYGLVEADAEAFRGNPIDRLAPLAAAKVPLLHVIGDADPVVPHQENTGILAERYRKLGGTIHVIAKPGVGHHPHALPDPRPIVEFLAAACRAAGADRSQPVRFADNLRPRAGLHRAHRVFTTTGRGHVAFMGGSITEMAGFRPLVYEHLRRRYPDCAFTFTAAGIASTCSTTGAFRLERDVLSKGPVDLFVVEFAVNDDQDAVHARTQCIRGMEGIVRQIRHHNPRADVIIVHFLNPRMLASLQRGELPLTIAAHEAVAEHYQVASVLLAREVADRTLRGTMTWQQFGGTHPKRPGNALAAAMIDALIAGAGHAPPGGTTPPTAPPPVPPPLEPSCYADGGFLPPTAARLVRGFTRGVPDWSRLPGSKRGRFTDLEMLSATTVGAELELTFRGTAIGAYVSAGPDAGMLEGTIDGRPFGPVNLYHRFSKGLHYPRTVMFADGLPAGEHRLVLRVAERTRSRGHAARIMQFTVNRSR